MKKLLLSLLLAAMCSIGAFAQKGMQGVGGNLAYGFGSHSYWAGMGVKYQYNLTDYVRLEPSYTQFFHHGGGEFHDKSSYSYAYDELNCPVWAAFINTQVFLFSPKPIRPYLIAGIGLIDRFQEEEVYREDYVYKSDDYSNHTSFDFGIGLDWRLKYNFSLQIEAKMFLLKEDGPGKLGFNSNIGLTYNF